MITVFIGSPCNEQDLHYHDTHLMASIPG